MYEPELKRGCGAGANLRSSVRLTCAGDKDFLNHCQSMRELIDARSVWSGRRIVRLDQQLTVWRQARGVEERLRYLDRVYERRWQADIPLRDNLRNVV